MAEKDNFFLVPRSRLINALMMVYNLLTYLGLKRTTPHPP
jgi:hypothetical protein